MPDETSPIEAVGDFLLFRPDGTLHGASAGADRLLEDRATAKAILAAVRDAARSKRAIWITLRNADASIAEIRGDAGRRLFVVHLHPLPEIGMLSPAQRRIAVRIAAGQPVPRVAAELKITPSTVRSHLQAIYRRLDVSTRVELLEAVSTSASAANSKRRSPALRGRTRRGGGRSSEDES